jgi:DNA-binding MarR family transcriptional regulator
VREEPDPVDVAAEFQASLGLLVRRLRQSPVQDELSVPEISALTRLDRGGPATSSTLARVEQITPQSMGVTLSSLVRRGLVERRPDAQDGRRIFLALTKTGQQVIRDKQSARIRQLGQALSKKFTSEELEILAAAVPLIERLGESI